MFKNNKKKLTELVHCHAMGEVAVPTELEQIMMDESEEIIKKMYDNKQGAIDMAFLIQKTSG